MSWSTASTHRDAGALQVLADSAPMNAQLSADLAQRPALGVQLGDTLNIDGGHRRGGPSCRTQDPDDDRGRAKR
jgi:hypothetical protein